MASLLNEVRDAVIVLAMTIGVIVILGLITVCEVCED